MNTKVLTTLEYTKIIDLLTEKADSEPGKKLCRDLVPSTDLSTVLWKSAVLCPCPNC